MEVSKTYTIQPQDVFELLQASFREDYKRNTGKELSEKSIVSGLTYIKSFGKNNHQQVKVVVEAMVFPVLYDVSIRSNRGVTRMIYQLQEMDNNRTNIIYREETDQTGFFAGWNYKLLAPFMRKSIEKRMLAQLDSIVNYAKQRRANNI